MVHEDERAAPRTRGDGFQRKLVVGIVGVLALLLAWWIIAATVPRWWAQRMGNLIDGRLTFGTFVGIVVGLLFTAIPLVVLWIGWRVRRGWRGGAWKRLAVFTIAALLLASPNLATLAIVFGTRGAAHAGERILDVDGPGFRGGSLVGAVLGVVAVGAVMWLAASRRRNKAMASEYRRELRDRPAPPSPDPA